MGRDPLGIDPLGIDPIVHIQKIETTAMQRAVDFYRHNILLKGTTVARTVDPGQPIGEDGEPMTWERRQQLASQRAKLDFAKVATGEIDYRKDNPDIQTEELGTSAQKRIDAQPDMTVVKDKTFDLRPLTDEEKKVFEEKPLDK